MELNLKIYRIGKIAVWAAVLFCLGAMELSALEIPIIVDNPRTKEYRGVYRRNEPVTGGIPLPMGKVWGKEDLSLMDGIGNYIPVQISPMARYEDGSLHWVFLTFLTDIAPGQILNFKLMKSPGAAKPVNPVMVEENSKITILSNGILRLALNGKKSGGIDQLSCYGKKIIESGAIQRVVMADKQNLVSGEPLDIRFEEKGPLQTTVSIKGPFLDPDTGRVFDGFGYTVRVTIFANSPVLKTEWLLKNSSPKHGQHLHIKRAWVELPVAAPAMEKRYDNAFSFSSKGGAGFVNIKNKGAFKRKLTFLEVKENHLVLDFIPAINKTMDHRKSGTYYTNLKDGGGAYWLSDMSFKGTQIDMGFFKKPVKDLKNWVFRVKAPLHARTESEVYAQNDGLGIGFFGSLEDEIKTYQNWQWKGGDNKKKQPWGKQAIPNFHKQYLHVHDVSEADQIRGLIVQYARTGGRSYLDRAMAWSGYMKYHYVPRTEGFKIRDVIMDFKGWHWGKNRPMKGDISGMSRWLDRGRADGCHDYGIGLGNYYLLTGDRESLSALEDLCEKYETLYQNTVPGKYATNPWGMRGIGRHLSSVSRAYSILGTEKMKKLMIRIARLILEDPNRDERGFIRKTKWVANFNGLMNSQKNPQMIRDLMTEKGITYDKNKKTPCSPQEGCWRVTQIGAWQQAIVAMGMFEYYRLSNDEDARDYLIAFAEAVKKYCISKACGHVYPYTTIGFPTKDSSSNPFKYWDLTLHCQPGKLAVHDGWYTNRMVNSMVIAYRLSGRKHLLETAKDLWNKGSKVNWWTLPKALDDEVYRFADIKGSTKNDDVSSVSLMFHEYAHPRSDSRKPDTITNLKARVLMGDDVELTWDAPFDNSGKASSYQVKYAKLPIKSYENFRYSLDDGKAVNWNYAKNINAEPKPGNPGKPESMKIKGLTKGEYFFSLRSYDDSMNQSDISNIASVQIQ